MSDPTAVYVYEWRAWEEFLLAAMFPNAARIRAKVGDDQGDVAAAVPGEGGCFIFQLNLTDTSNFPLRRDLLCRRLRGRGIRVVNGRVTDISKRKVQSVCRELGLRTTAAARAGSPDDLLIVKSDLNYGGYCECRLTADERSKLGVRAPLPEAGASGAWGEPTYRILHRGEVSSGVWDSDAYVVENYISNPQDLFYRVHLFLDHLVISRVVDAAPIKKFPAGVSRQDWHVDASTGECVKGVAGLPAPARLLKDVLLFRQGMGLDFGALDVVQDEEEAFYIIDVNVTPWWGEEEGGDRDVIDFLAAGLG